MKKMKFIGDFIFLRGEQYIVKSLGEMLLCAFVYVIILHNQKCRVNRVSACFFIQYSVINTLLHIYIINMTFLDIFHKVSYPNLQTCPQNLLYIHVIERHICIIQSAMYNSIVCHDLYFTVIYSKL